MLKHSSIHISCTMKPSYVYKVAGFNLHSTPALLRHKVPLLPLKQSHAAALSDWQSGSGCVSVSGREVWGCDLAG